MKKFLSVALALAMTLSLVVVGASAKDFTDNSKVNYKEAVDVISGIGVVNGYSDGDFKPTNTLTRGAAAKIICNLMLGPTAADAMGVSKAPFKDVSVKNVFSGYIAYCSTQGIINGYRDGTFRPSGTVTGFQFLKMLLGALGYDGSIQGFTGKNWTVNVAQLVIKTGLTKGNDSFVGSKAMTREEATLYALNLLKTPMVEYASKGTKITQADGSVISIGASAAKAVETNNDTNKIKNDNCVEFGEQYFPKLELDLTNTTDDFGRAANHWTYKNVDIGTYPTDTDVVVRYTASTTKSKVAKDLKGYNVSSLTKDEVYVNGKQEGASGASAIVANVTGANGIEDLTGNGRIVEVYSDGKDINKIVVINYVLGKVTAVSDTNETITVKDQTSSSSNSYTSEAGYGDYAKNSYVMIAPKASTLNADGTVATYLTGSTSGNEALAVAPVTKISGKITSVKQNDSAVVGGKTYESAANYVDSTFNPTVSDSATVAVYLDSYGYIVSCDATAAAGNYLLVTKVSWKTTDSLGNDVYKMQAVFTDGTSGVYTVNKLDGNTIADATDAVNNKIKFDQVKVGLYSYTVSGSKYELTSAESSNTSANYGHVWDENKSITNSTVKLNSQYFADDVNYIVVTNNGDSDMKVSQYTGKQNTAGDVAVYYLTSKSVETDQNGTITTAFVVGSDVVSSNSDVIFTTASQAASNGSAIIDGTRYTTYSVYMNGEKTTIPVKGDTIPSANKFYTYGKDSNGVYALNDTDSGVKTDKVVSAYNKYVTVADITDTLTATDDIKVVDTRSDVDTKIDSLSALADADGSVIASVVYNGDKNTVSYIYVTGVKSNACEMTALKINGSDAKLYTSAADAASGDKVSVAKDTAITLSGIAKSDDATAAYTYDGDYSSTFTSDGTLESGVTKTTAAGGCTDVVCIVVTAQDGKTSNTYYTAIEVGA